MNLRAGVKGIVAFGLLFSVLVARHILTLYGWWAVGAGREASSFTHHGVGRIEFVQRLQVWGRFQTPDSSSACSNRRPFILQLIFSACRYRRRERIFRKREGRRTRTRRPRQTGSHFPLVGTSPATPASWDRGKSRGFWVITKWVRALKRERFNAVWKDGVISLVLLDGCDEPPLSSGGRGRCGDGRVVTLRRQEAVGLWHSTFSTV